MDELLQKIHEAFDAFAKDAKLQEENGNIIVHRKDDERVP